jgi:hypothetical protein
MHAKLPLRCAGLPEHNSGATIVILLSGGLACARGGPNRAFFRNCRECSEQEKLLLPLADATVASIVFS